MVSRDCLTTINLSMMPEHKVYVFFFFFLWIQFIVCQGVASRWT
jgi:hypothetical protein